MKTLFQITATAIVLFGSAQTAVYPVSAQEVPTTAESAATESPVTQNQSNEPVTLQAHAGEDRNVIVGRTVLFDASGTTGPNDATYSYQWDFGDGSKATGIDATHTYSSRGTYTVTLTVTARVNGEPLTSQDTAVVSVQDRLVILMTDQSVPENEVQKLQTYALTQGVLLIPIRDSGVNQEYLTIQNLAQKILKNQENVAAADMIISWTSGNNGLGALIEFSRLAASNTIAINDFRFSTKAIVSVNNNQSLAAGAKTAQTAFQSIQPELIVVADRPILENILAVSTVDALQSELPGFRQPYQLITEYTARGLQQLGPLNFMSYAVNFMINRGVPVSSLYLVLMLPVIATIIAAARQVGGIKSFGIFAPTVIALSFLATGLKYGVTVFVVIIILGTAARLFARRFRLLYLPRMALVLSFLALAIFVMFLIGSYLNKTGFIAISIFPILIMTVITEHFLTVQIEQGYKTAVRLTFETLALSLVGYFIGNWTIFKTTILAYPELILLTLLLNYLIGKYSGLRITEYIRFRSVFKNIRNAQKPQ